MISIGIPFLNCAGTLPDAIRSVFAQSYKDWELILIDDGSTDGSAEIAGRVTDPRVRVVSDGRTLGLSNRLNQIASLARGEYLARMDGDDIMHPERLATQIAALAGSRSCDVLATGAFVIGRSGTPWGVTGMTSLRIDGRTAVSGPHILHPSIMARTEWFRANRYDPFYERGEDRELWCRVADTARFERIPRPLMYYRVALRLNLRTQWRSARYERAIARQYGPAHIGAAGTITFIGRSWLKTLAYATAHACRLDHSLVSRRYPRIPHELTQQAHDGLSMVQNTSVPGLDI